MAIEKSTQVQSQSKSALDNGQGRMSMTRLPCLLFSLCMALLLLLMAVVPVVSVAQQSEATGDGNSGPRDSKTYGVDVSWPMQHESIDHHQYENYMKGCYQQGYTNYEKRPDGLYQRKDEKDTVPDGAQNKKNNNEHVIACNAAEQVRLEMNLNQPKEIQNYTHAGYAKVHTPSEVFQLLKNFWEKNERYLWPEFWNEGNTYVNHWKVPTNLLDIGRKDVPHPFTTKEYETIIQSIQDTLESWTNQRLVLTSAYGIRAYGEGAILAPHVDRLPLVSSAIINVFQRNVTEPWVLEVIGHDGMAHNLTSESGEMILYESASVIHGRPYPLKGEGAMYGSLFVHFEPLYHTLRHAQTQKAEDHYDATTTNKKDQASKNAFEKALQEQLQKPTLQELLDKTAVDSSTTTDKDDTTTNTASSKTVFRHNPGYVWPEYSPLYDQQFFFEYEEDVYPKTSKTVLEKITSHQAATLGELNALKEIAKTQGRSELFKADHNGWKPIHEAARGGHADVIKYLLDEGAKVNERTNSNEGGNPLYWAKKNPKKNAKAIAMLERYGGVAVAPGDRNAAEIEDSATIKVDEDTEEKAADKNQQEK